MLILRTPKGWTGPEGGRRAPDRGDVPGPPAPAGRGPHQPRAPGPARGRGCAATGPRSSSTRTGCPVEAVCQFPPAGRPADERQPRTPTEASCCADLELPDFCDYGVEVPSPEPWHARGHPGAGIVLSATRSAANPSTFRLFGPDETSSNRLQDVFEVTDRTWDAELRPGDDHLAPDGRVMEIALRAPVPGVARGLPPHRPPRPLQLLRGVHPHRRLDVQPARQVAEGQPRGPVAPPHRLAQLPPLEPRLATGQQRLLPPGSRLHRPRGQQEGRGRPRLLPARHQLPPVGGRPLPAQPQLRQRRRGRQATPARLADHGRGPRPLHPRARHLVLRLERRRRPRYPTWSWPAAATSHPRDPGRGGAPASSTCPS